MIIKITISELYDGKRLWRCSGKKYAEEALDRKAKAGIQFNNYNCSIKAAKFKLKKETTIKEVRCIKMREDFQNKS